PRWGHFYLPTAHFGTFKSGPDKNAAVSIGLLFEFQGQLKVYVVVFRGQIAIFGLWATFTDQFAIFNIPFFFTMLDPPIQIFTIEKVFGGCLRKAELNGQST